MAKGDSGKGTNSARAKQTALYGFGSRGEPGDANYIPGTAGGLRPLAEQQKKDTDYFRGNMQTGVAKSMQSYDDIMGAYNDFIGRGSAAKAGYSELASAGGGVDANSMRARAMGSVRSVYDSAKRALDRNRSIQGGYNPGYTTGVARMAREQSQGAADASTNAEASIQDLISRNRIAGLSGLTGIEGQELGANNARASLYSATPGMASTFGNQFLQSNNQQMQLQELVNNWLAGNKSSKINWQGILSAASTAAPYIAMAASDRNIKEDIEPANEDDVLGKLKGLDISTWKYKGDDTKHLGPMAQDFKKQFGVGDGKTIHLVDVMGVMTSAMKALAKNSAVAHA